MGTGTMPGVFGMAGMEHMRKYGTTQAQFAQISVKNHEHAMGNPLSQYHVRLSLEDVLNSRTVAYPNTLYMCCPTGDGAAATVLMNKSKIKQYTSQPIKIAASALTTDPYTSRDLTFPDINTMTRNAAEQAYEEAGLGPEDINSVELHDCFATAELLHYENLMLAPEGEGGRWVDEKFTDLAGPAGRQALDPRQHQRRAPSRRATRWARPALPTSARSPGRCAARRATVRCRTTRPAWPT